MEQLVSIILPVYNGEKFIERAIRSVLAQTYKYWELIVIDDGSIDKTSEIVKRYLNEKVKYLYQKNSGVSIARNKGIKISNGDYIAFLDCDDVWKPEKLQVQLSKFMENYNVGLIYTDVFIVTERGKILGKFSQFNYPYSNKVTKKLFLQNFICTSSVIINKEILKKTGLFDPDIKIGEDYDLFFRLSLYTNFYYVDNPLLYYQISEKGLSRNKIKMWEENIKILDKWLKKYPELTKILGTKTIKEKKSNLFILLGKEYFENGKFTQAQKTFYKAITYKKNIKGISLFLLSFLGKFGKFLLSLKQRILK